MTVFKLPDLGEGLPEAEIVEWFVKEGDEVSMDQIIVSMETAKAIVDIPSPQTGRITKLYGQAGEIIHTGDPLLEFSPDVEQSDETQGESQQSHRESSSVVGELPEAQETVQETAQSVSPNHGQGHLGVKATPAVRALARRYDIDLSVVTPSGPDGTVKATDVERVVKIFSEVGELRPLKGVRRAMAKSMTQSHAEVVPVTLNDDADISHWSRDADITVRLIRAMVSACADEPALNSWYDSHSIGRRLIKQVHLGLAVDSKEGLFVPVIRDVGSIHAELLRDKIATIKQLIEQRKISPEDLRGNTITLSNFGSLGGKYANPIIVPPTVSILGAGRSYSQLALKGGKTVELTMLPLSLTFDHRAVTGGEAGRFLQTVIKDLESKI